MSGTEALQDRHKVWNVLLLELTAFVDKIVGDHAERGVA
jgi:hypothetical protein